MSSPNFWEGSYSSANKNKINCPKKRTKNVRERVTRMTGPSLLTHSVLFQVIGHHWCISIRRYARILLRDIINIPFAFS